MIRSKEELEHLQESLLPKIRLRVLGEATSETTDIFVLLGEEEGGIDLLHSFLDPIVEKKLDHVRVIGVDRLETNLPRAAKVIEPNGRGSVYVELNAKKVLEIVEKHIEGHTPVEAYLDR